MPSDSQGYHAVATIFVFDTSQTTLNLLAVYNYTHSCSGTLIIPLNSTSVLVGCPQSAWIGKFTKFFYMSYTEGQLHVSTPTQINGTFVLYDTNYVAREAYFILPFFKGKEFHTELHALNLDTLEDRVLIVRTSSVKLAHHIADTVRRVHRSRSPDPRLLGILAGAGQLVGAL